MPPSRSRGHVRYRERLREQEARRRRNRSLAIAAVSVAAVVVAGVVVVGTVRRAADRRAHDLSLAATRDRTGAAVVSRDTAPLTFAPPAASYHVVYEVHDRATKADVVTTEEDWVRRPFESRQEVRAGAPPGKKLTATTINGFALFEQRNEGASSSQVLQVPPNLANDDLRLDPVRADAVAAKALTVRERRRVSGRECQVVRSAKATAAGVLGQRDANDPTAITDVCVDRQGIVLEEVTFRDARIVHRRVATKIEVDQPIDESRFATTPGTPVDVTQGGGSVRRLQPTSRPPGGQFYELDGAPPAGFTLRGRYTVIPPQPEAFSDPTKRDSRVAGVADVYERGADFVVIDRGSTLGGAPAFTRLDSSKPVDLGPLGTGEVILSMNGSQVRVILPDGHYLRVLGTLPADDLVAIARRMQPQPAGELQFLDGS